jgi:exodeoxyribonuclease V gamma subunit
MLYLHVSNRTENLLQHLVHVFQASERRDLFEKEYFLIQSQGMERMISQTLAANFTSWCNFEYFLPLSFLKYSAEKLGMEITPDGYERKIMAWRIEELLRELHGEEYQPLRSYLQGENLDLKRYQLADQLSNIYDQYQMMRPEMLAAWSQNRLVNGDPSEIWQRSLWARLTERLEGAPHRGMVLQKVIDRLRTGDNLSQLLPERVSVFGLSIMPPLFLGYLQGLARHCEVHLYVLSPCKEYWGDIESRRKLLQRSLNSNDPQILEMDDAPESHPLLVSLGQQGRDFQRMLFDDVHFELEFASYEEPLNTGELTLLRQLQSDLLKGEVMRSFEPWPAGDQSIRITACHSRLREIMVLREHILRWLYEDPDLKLRDIVVMAPDIQEYSALIPAVFSDIQHSISDRSLRRRNAVLAAYDDFMGLFQGRFGWDQILDLLKEPVIAEKLQLAQSDLESIQQWVTQSGIRWGLSGKHRGEMGLPEFDECSWSAGLQRLLMGYAIDSDEFVDGILPFIDIEGSGAAALGGLCQFVGLLEKARTDFAGKHTLKAWSALLIQYAGQLFLDDSERSSTKEYLELHEILASLGDNPGEFHHSDVDFTVIRTWLEHMARETRSSSGFLRGQLTFCSMLPMRSIPFKSVCIIGLNDGAFPAIDRSSTFDLMGSSHKPGDRSRRMDDRYQFLEALMAAREHLYLSYIGQSIKNNEKIPPSVVVTELQELLSDYYGAKDVVVFHPLHPFSSRYFAGLEPEFFSYDETYCAVAKKLQQPSVPASSWWSGQRDLDIREIHISDLFRFYSNPQRWFVQNCLGIRLGGDIEVIAESETFTPEGLDKYLLDQELLDLLLHNGNPDSVQKKLRVTGRWPLGAPGAIAYESKITELRGFAESVADANMGVPAEDIAIDIEVGGYHLTGMLSNVYENGIMLCRYSNMKGKDLLVGWLHHLLYAEMVGKQTDTVIFAKDGSKRLRAGSTAEPTLEALVHHFVAGCRQPSPLYIEPGIAWVKKVEKGEGMQEAALSSLEYTLSEGYDAELALLLRNTELLSVLGEDFEELCETVLLPIWRCANAN